MNESSETTPLSPEINPEQYLESIGPANKHNVSLLRNALQETAQIEGIGGFMLAVGGTVTKENPDKRKDIDIRVGVKVDTNDIKQLPLLQRYEQQFERWSAVVNRVIGTINTEGEFEVEIDPPHPDREHEWMAANDGMVRIIPKKSGVPIEILCHQEGSRIPPPFVKLFSNIDFESE